MTMTNKPEPSHRCICIKRNNQQCGSHALPNHEFCHAHSRWPEKLVNKLMARWLIIHFIDKGIRCSQLHGR